MPNIEELEKDVETFHDNIKNSNDLINKINTQTETLDSRMSELNEVVDKATDNLIKSNEKVTTDFASMANQSINNYKTISEGIIETTKSTQSQYLGQLDEMYKMEFERQQQIEASQQKVANMLNANASLFEGFPDNVVSEFNKKLLDYEKRMNIRIAIGFASTIALAIISFFF